jgi:ABC-type glycerol-3-phosphate transport system substrate-binding protein
MSRWLLPSVIVALLVLSANVNAQNRESALAALAKLPAAERQARLVEGAKKENGLVWYSSTTAEDALALSKKFNEQHPAIKINHFRSSVRNCSSGYLPNPAPMLSKPISSPCLSWNCR